MLIQLKPSEEVFSELVFNRLVRLDAILLCEGKTEVEVVKAIIKKLDIKIKSTLGLTDCEGIEQIPKLASVIALLARISRKLKALMVLVDAENLDFIDRAKSITNSLRSKELQTTSLQSSAYCNNVFELQIKTNSRILPLIIAVSGVEEFGFVKHYIEDHIVKLMLLEGKIDNQEISKYSEAKQVVRGDEIINIIKESSKGDIESAFKHITCLLSYYLKKFCSQLD